MKHLQQKGNLIQAESPVTAGCAIQGQTTALLQTLLSGSVSVWGTGPNANSRGFCYCYRFTLLQIIVETIRDKGCTASSGISPLQDYDVNVFQVSQLYSLMLIKRGLILQDGFASSQSAGSGVGTVGQGN